MPNLIPQVSRYHTPGTIWNGKMRPWEQGCLCPSMVWLNILISRAAANMPNSLMAAHLSLALSGVQIVHSGEVQYWLNCQCTASPAQVDQVPALARVIVILLLNKTFHYSPSASLHPGYKWTPMTPCGRLQPWSKHLGTVMKIKSENALLK